MKRQIFALVALLATTMMSSAFAQSAELVSRYVWRGAELDGVSLQPSFDLSVDSLTIGAWGS